MTSVTFFKWSNIFLLLLENQMMNYINKWVFKRAIAFYTEHDIDKGLDVNFIFCRSP